METLQAALAVQAQYWGGCLGRAADRLALSHWECWGRERESEADTVSSHLAGLSVHQQAQRPG